MLQCITNPNGRLRAAITADRLYTAVRRILLGIGVLVVCWFTIAFSANGWTGVCLASGRVATLIVEQSFGGSMWKCGSPRSRSVNGEPPKREE
jgi:hypothetical protein